MLQSQRKETEGKLQMLLSLRKMAEPPYLRRIGFSRKSLLILYRNSRLVVLQIILPQASSKDSQEHTSITTLVVVRAGQTLMQRIKRGRVSTHEVCLPPGPCGESSGEVAPHKAKFGKLILNIPLRLSTFPLTLKDRRSRNPDREQDYKISPLIAKYIENRGQKINADFFCTKFFENPSGHGRPHRKFVDVRTTKWVSCGPAGSSDRKFKFMSFFFSEKK